MHTFSYSAVYIPSAPMVEIMLSSPHNPHGKGIYLSALIDSGADATLLPIDLLRKVQARVVESVNLIGITGARTTVDLYHVVIQIGPHKFRSIKAVAQQIGAEPIIGRDVLNHLVVTLNGLAGMTEIAD